MMSNETNGLMNSAIGTRFLCVLTLVAIIGLTGCGGIDVPPPGDNGAPLADAGADQAVSGGSPVQLNGAASSDPDGDSLSYAWTQIAGSPVSLTDADTSTPSFTAPDEDTTMIFELTVDDGTSDDTDLVEIACTAEEDDNQPPSADAGDDDLVDGGSTVQLDGGFSSDPDGDALSFSWSQTGGPDVAIAGAATETPTFTAPNEDTTLTFDLTVSDGNGGSDTDSVEIEVIHTPSMLFVANLLGSNVTGWSNPASLNGNIAPDSNLAGAQTKLVGPTDIVVDKQGALITSNLGLPHRITAHDDALSINGNIAPDRNVEGVATLLDQPTSVAINRASDLVFVANVGAVDRILVYPNASQASFNGNLPPVRTIETTTSLDLQTPMGINFGANDELYVANRGGNNILIFADASNTNGDVTPSRIIESAAFGGLMDVYIDGADNMYVVNDTGGGNQVHVFANASTLNGLTAPDFSLTVVGAVNLTAIAVDSEDTAYLVDANDHAIYAYDGISTLNGALAPDRTIQGANTQLNTPIRVFLME